MTAPNNQRSVTIGETGLVMDHDGERQDLPLLSGAMHYFQLPRRVWGACLDAVAGLGLEIVESYVPWVVHERGRGSFEFAADGSGGRSSSHLQAFLDLCAERELKVILRPGPHINAELTGFGFPWRILEDEQCLARGARGNPVIMPTPPRCFPVPSYASERFLEEASTWLSAFADFVRPYQWPDGPLVAAQVDNELSLFFRTAAYDQDYHPDAIDLFREFVGQRYGDRLPPSYAGSLDSLEPPRQLEARAAEQLVPHLDWIASKEWMLARALGRMAGALRDGGLDRVPLLHNLPATRGGDLCSLPSTERQVDLAGLDLYLPRRDYRNARRAGQLAAGCSRLPTLTELGWGGWLWWYPQNLEDQLSNAVAALMHGVKGFNVYMAVGRDRWYGAPIDADGRTRGEAYEVTRSLIAAVKDSGLPALTRPVKVAIMRVRDYRRLSLCTSLVNPLPPMGLALLNIGAHELSSDETFGFDSPIQREVVPYEAQVEETLDDLHIAFHLVDSETSPERLGRYALLVVPTFEFIDSELLERLAVFVDGGGTLLCGPRTPALDRTMRPLDRELPAHTMASVETLHETLEDLLDKVGVGEALRCDSGAVELACYRGHADGTVLFAANRSDTSCATAITGIEEAGGKWCWDALTGDPVDLSCLHLQAQQVRMLRIERARPDGEESR